MWNLWKLECGLKALFFFFICVDMDIWIYFILLFDPFDPFLPFPYVCVLVLVFLCVCGFMPSPAWFRAVFVCAVGDMGLRDVGKGFILFYSILCYYILFYFIFNGISV